MTFPELSSTIVETAAALTGGTSVVGLALAGAIRLAGPTLQRIAEKRAETARLLAAAAEAEADAEAQRAATAERQREHETKVYDDLREDVARVLAERDGCREEIQKVRDQADIDRTVSAAREKLCQRQLERVSNEVAEIQRRLREQRD